MTRSNPSSSKLSQTPSPPISGEPYCSNCGYALRGAIDSSKCPECGRPLVEVLARRGWLSISGKRWRSKATLFGWPVIDVALGPGPSREGEPGPPTQKRGRARGIIAIGDIATGGVAIGGFARGVVAFGGMCVGGFTFGGFSVGVITAAGGLALSGLMAVGGLAASAGLSFGGLAVGAVAQGGQAIGMYARGGMAKSFGAGGGGGTELIAAFDRYSWFFGPWPPTGLSQIYAAASVIVPGLVVGMIIAGTAWLMHVRAGSERVAE